MPYDKPQIVLLDVLHRSETGETVPHEKLETIAKSFGLQPKRLVAQLKSRKELEGFLRRVDTLDYRYHGRPVEGFVIEDARGFRFKVKTPFYAFWKQLRGQVGMTVSHRYKGSQRKPFDPGAFADPALAARFLAWVDEQDTEVLKTSSILALKRAFETTAAWTASRSTVTRPPTAQGSAGQPHPDIKEPEPTPCVSYEPIPAATSASSATPTPPNSSCRRSSASTTAASR